MKYPLCGTTFTAHECEIIDRSYFPTLLSWMGFNPITKLLLFFGPPSLGCFGFTNNYTDQGIIRVLILLSDLRHQDEIGHMIQILTENVQLVIGLSLRFFNVQSPSIYTIYRIIPDNECLGVSSFYEGTSSIGGLIRAWNTTGSRSESHGCLDPSRIKELKRLSACRHFLQVVSIADLCDATGRFITSNIFKGNRHTDRRSSYKWPHQQKLSPVAWALWGKTLGRTISTPTGRLRIPLGNWLSRPIHQHWTFHLDMTKHRLVEQREGGLYLL